MPFRLKRHKFLVVYMYQNGIVIRRISDDSSQFADATGAARVMLERAFPQAGQPGAQGVAQNTAAPVVNGQPVYSDIALADYMAKQAARQKFGDATRSGAEAQQTGVTEAGIRPELEHTTTAIPENVVASAQNDGIINRKSVPKDKPYARSRPNYAKGQVEAVWELAKDPKTRKVYDPTGVEITWDRTKPRNGQWDMGHIPGQKYSEIFHLYMQGVISKEEFLAWYRDPNNYRPELPSTNRSHLYE